MVKDLLDDLDKDILELVARERERQYDKWGDQSHSNEQWKAILLEELAEVNTCIAMGELGSAVEELAHAAAVICAAIRDLARDKGGGSAPLLKMKDLKRIEKELEETTKGKKKGKKK